MQVKIIVEISVWWSVTFPIVALVIFVKVNMPKSRWFKETAMPKLHEMVMFGVALLPVPGRIGQHQFG